MKGKGNVGAEDASVIASIIGVCVLAFAGDPSGVVDGISNGCCVARKRVPGGSV